MNIKLTKKDKTMLLILLVVVVVALFYMKGIKPLKAQIDEVSGKITEQETAIKTLEGEIEEIKKGLVVGDRGALLDEYYVKRESMKDMHTDIEGTAVDRAVSKIFDKYHIEGYSTIGWGKTEVKTEKKQFKEDPNIADITYSVAHISTSFRVEKKEDFYSILTEFRQNPYYVVKDFRLSYVPPAEDEGGVATTDGEGATEEKKYYELEGSITMDLMMGAPYKHEGDSNIPNAIAPIKLEDIKLKEKTKNTIVFPLNKNVTTYEFYYVTTNEDGTKEYSLIHNTTYIQDSKTNTVEAKIMTATPGSKIIIVEIGDFENTYKTLKADANVYEFK